MNHDNYRRNLINAVIDLSKDIYTPKTIEADIVEILKKETKKAIKVNETNRSDKVRHTKHHFFDLPAPVKLKVKQNEGDLQEKTKPTVARVK